MFKKVDGLFNIFFDQPFFLKKVGGLFIILMFAAAMIPINAVDNEDIFRDTMEKIYARPLDGTISFDDQVNETDYVYKKFQTFNKNVGEGAIHAFMGKIQLESSLTTGILKDDTNMYQFYNDYLGGVTKRVYKIEKTNQKLTAKEIVDKIPAMKSWIENVNRHAESYAKLSPKQQVDRLYNDYPDIASIGINLKEFSNNIAKITYVMDNSYLDVDWIIRDIPTVDTSEEKFKEYNDTVIFIISNYAKQIRNNGIYFDTYLSNSTDPSIDLTKLLGMISQVNETLHTMDNRHFDLGNKAYGLQFTGGNMIGFGVMLAGGAAFKGVCEPKAPLTTTTPASPVIPTTVTGATGTPITPAPLSENLSIPNRENKNINVDAESLNDLDLDINYKIAIADDLIKNSRFSDNDKIFDTYNIDGVNKTLFLNKDVFNNKIKYNWNNNSFILYEKDSNNIQHFSGTNFNLKINNTNNSGGVSTMDDIINNENIKNDEIVNFQAGENFYSIKKEKLTDESSLNELNLDRNKELKVLDHNVEYQPIYYIFEMKQIDRYLQASLSAAAVAGSFFCLNKLMNSGLSRSYLLMIAGLITAIGVILETIGCIISNCANALGNAMLAVDGVLRELISVFNYIIY